MAAGVVCLLLATSVASAGDVPSLSGSNAQETDYFEQALFSAPFAEHRGSFFYSALNVPMLETAATLPAGSTYVRLSVGQARSVKGPALPTEAGRRDLVQSTVQAGQQPDDVFVGNFNTWLALDWAHGVLPWLDVGARMAFAGWGEKNDNFYFFDENGVPAVQNEARDIYAIGASKRQNDLSEVVLKTKARLLRSGGADVANTLSLEGSVKLPLGQANNLVDAGTVDLALTLLDSLVAGPIALHMNVSAVLPTGTQNIFIPEDNVSLDPFLAGGVGLTWRASDTLTLGIQAEGNTSAFGDVPFLDGNVLTVSGGARQMIGNYVLEASYGRGCTVASSDWSWFLSVGRRF
jgi:hypothetical protein